MFPWPLLRAAEKQEAVFWTPLAIDRTLLTEFGKSPVREGPVPGTHPPHFIHLVTQSLRY